MIFFLASVQRVPGCLIEGGDCGEGGLALLSFHVITGHIRIKARNAELWITLLIWNPRDAANETQTWILTPGGGNRLSVG